MSPRVRICIDLTPCEMRDRYGGFGRYGLALLANLGALSGPYLEGIELVALTRSDGRPVPVDSALHGTPAEEPMISARRHRLQRRLLMGRALRAANVDLLHAITPVALPLAAPCPIVATVHDIIPVVCPEPGLGLRARVRRLCDRIQLRQQLQGADHYIAISEATRRDVTRVFGVAPARITVVHHGVDATLFNDRALDGERERIRARHRLPERWFLSVGSDHYRKNQSRLYDAWRRLSASMSEGLVLVGRPIHDGWLHRVEDEARRDGLAGRVRWARDVGDDELPALYRHATALVAPSTYEGFGMTVLEGMACGTPVVAARTDAHLEVGGEAALFFEATSVDALAEALGRIAGDESLRRELRARGLARSRRFTWQNAARETAQLYRRILRMPEARGPDASGVRFGDRGGTPDLV